MHSSAIVFALSAAVYLYCLWKIRPRKKANVQTDWRDQAWQACCIVLIAFMGGLQLPIFLIFALYEDDTSKGQHIMYGFCAVHFVGFMIPTIAPFIPKRWLRVKQRVVLC